jgi:hypothetical protein
LQVGLGQSQQPRINTFNLADLLEQLAGVSLKRLDGVHPVDFKLSQVAVTGDFLVLIVHGDSSLQVATQFADSRNVSRIIQACGLAT